MEFIVPLLASIIQGAIGHGLAANQAANERNEQITLARRRREDLQPIIDKLRKAGDFFDMEEQLARDLGRASNQIDANAASTGMANAGSGGADNIRGDLLGSMIAQLAQAKQQDDLQRTQMLAEILSDPTLNIGELTPGNALGQTLLGGLLGGVSGMGTLFSGLLSSEAGIEYLDNIGKSDNDKLIAANTKDLAKRIADGSVGLPDIFGQSSRKIQQPGPFVPALQAPGATQMSSMPYGSYYSLPPITPALMGIR